MESSGYVKAYTAPAAASWEVDLFGKLLNASRGQKASYLQSQYSRQAVRSQLIGGIANTYYTLLMLDRQVEITAKTVDIYKENILVMEAMKIAGMATEAAVTQMRAAYHQVSGSLIELESQVRSVENSLSVLLAKAPQQIDRGTLEEQVMPEDIMVGVSSGRKERGDDTCQCLLYDEPSPCRFLSGFEYHGYGWLDERFRHTGR